MHRFFVENLAEGEGRLPASEAHHAAHVLRLKPGDDVELFDGRGGAAGGRIVSVCRGEVALAVGPVRRRDEPDGRRVHLAFAVPKGKRLDWLLEKATELAAASLQPVAFERSVAAGPAGRAAWDRWRGHCVAAAKQCGLDRLPELHEPAPLPDFLAGCEAAVRLLGDADVGADPPARPLARVLNAPQSEFRNPNSVVPHPESAISLLVGPEGGLTPEERPACVAAGFAPVRLGRTTLRIETAAVALLAAVVGLTDGT